ncbi:UNVERIFIED_CONTAM: hypothetical protein GTU68_054273 [Idotea baltica]|nr:hypothetical protein [Idotea baltica]
MAKLEDEFLYWDNDKNLVINSCLSTLKDFEESFNLDESLNKFELKSIEWVETDQFTQALFTKTILHEEELEKYIEPKLKNWELDRINQMDHILIKMAICEVLHFPTIPIKVTINEYIELAKLYGTNKSKDFVNGIVDVLVQQFKKDGLIQKKGRGLIN